MANRKSKVFVTVVTGASLLLILGSASLHGATIAYYRFETENGMAVTNNQPLFRSDDSSGMGNHLVHAARNTVNSTNRYEAFSGSTPFPSRVPRTGAGNAFHLGNPPNNISLVRNGLGLSLTNFTGLSGKEQVTLELFLRRNSGDGGSGRALFEVSTWPQTGNGAWYSVSTTMSNMYDNTSLNRFNVVVNGYGTISTPYFADLKSRSRHFALTIHKTGYDRADYAFYLDGACMYTTNYYFRTASGNVPFSIAGRINGDSAPFTGIIDEVRVSDVVLPPEKFLGHYVPFGTTVLIR